MYKLDLGDAIAVSPQCYKNFLAAHRDRLGNRIFRASVNAVLKETGANATLRRIRLKTPRDVFTISKRGDMMAKSYYGSWYLEFKSKRDYTAFVLRWS